MSARRIVFGFVDINGNFVPAQLDASGNLKVTGGGGGGSNAAAGSTGSAVPASADFQGIDVGGTLRGAKGFDLDSGAGTEFVQGVSIRKTASGGSVEAATLSDPLRVDPTGTTTQPVSGTVTANVGTTNGLALDATLTGGSQKSKLVDSGGTNVASVSAAGALKVDASGVAVPITDNSGSLTVDNAGTFAVQAAQSGTWTVQPGNTANTTPWLVTPAPATSGGLSTSRTLSAASTNATSVKGSAGQVYGWAITNTNASPRVVKLYNKATAPTVGTDTPLITLVIPGNASGAGMLAADFSTGIAFGTGIGLAITTGVADSDTGAVAANEVVVNLFYK